MLPTLRKNNLSLYYPFDIDINDYSTGTGINNGSLQGGAIISNTYTRDTSGSLYLSNTYTSPNVGQYFTTSPITPTTNMTFAIWMKIHSFTTNASLVSRIFDFGNSGTLNNNIILQLAKTDNSADFDVVPVIFNGTNLNLYPTIYKLNDANWHHYCLTISQTATTLTMKAYIDGYLLYNGTSSTLYSNRSTLPYCYIGKSNLSGNYNVDAYFNNFVYYNRAVTQSEMGLLFGVKNTILNGSFDQFYLLGINATTTANEGAYSNTNMNNGCDSYDVSPANQAMSLSTNIVGWDFSYNLYAIDSNPYDNIVLLNGNNSYFASNQDLSNQQYALGMQFYMSSGTLTTNPYVNISQYVYLENGNYTVSFYAMPRYGAYDTNNGLLLQIYDSNNILISNYTDISFATSTIPWTKYTYTLTIPSIISTNPTSIYLFVFSFLKTSNYTIDSTIYLTDIEIRNKD